jgi:hypothetical protein
MGTSSADDLDTNPFLYSSIRYAASDTTNPKRQLLQPFNRRSPDTTVITWCRYHRKLDKDGKTVSLGDTNNYDNVLFLDGSVQYVPIVQFVGSSTTTECRKGWNRYPLQAQSLNTSACS